MKKTSDVGLLILRKYSNFQKLPIFIQLWLFPACLCLGISRTLIRLIPFYRIAPYLGKSSEKKIWTPLLTIKQEKKAKEISRLITLAARYTPGQSNCFPQALTARFFCGLLRIPYVLYFGLSRDLNGTGMKAHAWVVAGRVYVTGGNSFLNYTVVESFMSSECQGFFKE